MAFNEWIHRWGLIGYKDPKRTYTWSNNQKDPIMDKLDRFLASVEWGLKYPLSKLDVLPRSVSDHSPFQITFRTKSCTTEPLF
jgi:hypothetical protein